jgi:hypothetical protein
MNHRVAMNLQKTDFVVANDRRERSNLLFPGGVASSHRKSDAPRNDMGRIWHIYCIFIRRPGGRKESREARKSWNIDMLGDVGYHS